MIGGFFIFTPPLKIRKHSTTERNLKGYFMTIEPIRVTQKQASELLAITVTAIKKLVANDDTFPKPYKTGTSRQAGVYFDYQALKQWHKAQGGNQ